jgi:hypothetical protein
MKIPFALMVLLALLVSALAPGWSRAQSLQGYYHDLVAGLSTPPEVIAGAQFTAVATAANRGPEAAVRPTILVAADSSVEWTASGGCIGSPAVAARCELPVPVLPLASAAASFTGLLAADARGSVVLGAALHADGEDVAPGDELVVRAVPIRTLVDLRVELVARTTTVDGGQRVSLNVVNAGPSSIERLAATWQAEAGGAQVPWSCTPILRATCPSASAYGRSDRGGIVQYTFVFPPFDAQASAMRLDFSAEARDADSVGGSPSLLVAWGDELSRDGFE